MNSEEFKACITKQLRDSDSDFQCLLHNLDKRDIDLYSHMFRTMISLKWAEVSNENPGNPSFHHALFEAGTHLWMIDITGHEILAMLFDEEVILLDGHHIIFGLRTFKLEHTDYIYKKVYTKGLIHTDDFDMREYRFKEHRITRVDHQWQQECIHRVKHQAYPIFSYLGYKFDKDKEILLQDFLKTNGLNPSEITEIVDIFKNSGPVFSRMTQIRQMFIEHWSQKIEH